MGIYVLSDFRSLKVKQSLFTFISWQFATKLITLWGEDEKDINWYRTGKTLYVGKIFFFLRLQ